MSKLNLRTFLKCIYRRMARLERAVLLLLCIFAVKFVFSTAAHFAAPLQVVDMLGSGRNPVDVWLLLLSCTAVLGTFCLYRRAARAIGAKCTKADAVILAVCIAASAAFYLHAMVGRQSLYLWDNATYYNFGRCGWNPTLRTASLPVSARPSTRRGSTTTRRWSSICWRSRSSCSRRAQPTRLRCSAHC